jgi:hypothetical protein
MSRKTELKICLDTINQNILNENNLKLSNVHALILYLIKVHQMNKFSHQKSLYMSLENGVNDT